MIIVCPECSTKFNVHSDRIPDNGAKVRCARCKHIFLVEKPVEEKPFSQVIPEENEQRPSAESVTQVSVMTEIPNETETETEDSDFSYDRFQELDSHQDQDENFSFGSDFKSQMKNFSTGSHTTDDTSEDNFTFSKAEEDTISPIEKVFAAKNAELTATNETATASSEEITQAFTPERELPAEPEIPSQPVSEKKNGPFASIIRILLLLILAIIIIGGVLIYMNGPDQLNQTIQQFFGQQTDRPVQTGQITLTKLEGKFIQNEQAGELFLIRGEATNNYNEARAGIQVKGVIFDQNGKPLLQKTVFCGNPISDEELQSLSFAELEKLMGNQFGNGLSNMKLDRGQTIPFDIVFKELPQNLAEFSVKVTASKPATK